MDMRVYKKTRYQNIYKHIKNGNYIISLSKPIKTSISTIEDRKIYSIEEALRVKDKYSRPISKSQIEACRDDFDVLWYKYIDWCKYSQKMAYNTLLHKEKDYKSFLKGKIDKPIAKTDKEFWAKYIDNLNTTLKQKNEIIKQLKAFFNWCVQENILLSSPLANINRYRVSKTEMKYWVPEQIKIFFETIKKDMTSSDTKLRRKAYLIYMFTHITLSVGNRPGESRALSFLRFNKEKCTVKIENSINYDRKSDNFFSDTKTRQSDRENFTTIRVIDEVEKYKTFLEEEYDVVINDSDLIFFNYSTKKPITDTTIRKYFKYYCDKAGVPYIRLYDLRHTFATNLVASNTPIRYVQESLGHTNASTTLNQYVHTRKDIKITVAEQADSYF